MSFPFETVRARALALLNSDARLTRKAGSFLGQCAVDPMPLTDSQLAWLESLSERNSLPALDGGAE